MGSTTFQSFHGIRIARGHVGADTSLTVGGRCSWSASIVGLELYKI